MSDLKTKRVAAGISGSVLCAKAGLSRSRLNPIERGYVDPSPKELARIYGQLVGERTGLFGALTSRAEAHVLRLSCIYALLDRSTEVRRCHLEAALALWKYCEDSAEFIFGAALGNQVADQILKALGSAPDGLTRNDLRDLFGRHRSSGEIAAALRILGDRSLVESDKEFTAGRPVERWFAASEEARKARKAREGVGE